MKKLKNKIAIMVGAGAVKNAWLPVLNSFNLLGYGEIDIDGANCLFARYIYLLRIYSKYADVKSAENLNIETENLNFLKSIICGQIKQAQEAGILEPRTEFSDVLKKFVFNDPNYMFGIISTNWDTTIDREADRIVKNVYVDVESAKCFHIHGNVDNPHQIYLPSEMSQENYRSDDENRRLGTDIFLTMDFLMQAKQIILYGLSLDPLDAELCQILNGVFSSTDILREVIIVNPDYNKVKNRLRLLLHPRKDIIIKCFEPEKLN
jgi:hypothetical protein